MSEEANEFDDDKPGLAGPVVSALAIAALIVLWFLGGQNNESGLALAFNIAGVVVISIVIWQACDPFADSAQWIGDRFHLPGSVRGATLDAVASSLPELFTGIFFVVLAVSRSGETAGTAEIYGEGYGSTVATCAGSAVYNMILIPAFVALVISFSRKKRPTVDVEDKVIARDGMAFLLCEIVLLIFLFMNELYWWMGLVFIGMYIGYIVILYSDWKRFEVVKKAVTDSETGATAETIRSTLHENGIEVPLRFVDQVRLELSRRGGEEDDDQEGDDEEGDSDAGVLFGFISIPLNNFNAWGIIAVSTLIAAVACFFLVEVTHDLATILKVPTFFMAVIVAAAASSVPDTFLSIGAAKRGDDSGAVSNAFGSNIFDICICLSIPLIISCGLNGWAPITLMQMDVETGVAKPMAGLVGLRILLATLTIVTLAIMWHNRQLNRKKALVLCFLYAIFIAYAVLGSMGIIDV